MASTLSGKVHILELCVTLLGEMIQRLRYLSPTMEGLMRSLAAQERFKELGFVEDCYRGILAGNSFPESWRQSLQQREKLLGKEGTELLASLGDVLGKSDLDSQLNALECTASLLEERVEQARQSSKKHGSLYRTMGVLGGIAIAIILI